MLYGKAYICANIHRKFCTPAEADNIKVIDSGQSSKNFRFCFVLRVMTFFLFHLVFVRDKFSWWNANISASGIKTRFVNLSNIQPNLQKFSPNRM